MSKLMSRIGGWIGRTLCAVGPELQSPICVAIDILVTLFKVLVVFLCLCLSTSVISQHYCSDALNKILFI